MLNWIRNWRHQRAKKVAMELGNRVVYRGNAALDEWQAASLEMRRQMLADTFDERLTNLKAEDGLSLAEMADIEGVALLKNWIEQKEAVLAEITNFIDADTWKGIKALEGEVVYSEKMGERFDAVGQALSRDLEDAIEEELQRREAGQRPAD